MVLAVFSAKANLEANKRMFGYAYIDIINNINMYVYFDHVTTLKTPPETQTTNILHSHTEITMLTNTRIPITKLIQTKMLTTREKSKWKMTLIM